MSTLKKVLALTLALAMILSVSAFAGFYKADTYKDAASIDKDCEDAVELMYALDIMQGDAQGNFRPNDTITRAEIAKMIYVIKNYGKDDKAVTYQDAKIFSDVPATAWYAGYVNYCGVTKLIQGRGNGTFGPTDPVTTAAAAKMLLTAIGYDAEARGYVGANWDKNVLSDAAVVGLLDDYNYSTIGAAPRQWVAVMFQNALLNAYTYKTMVAIPTNGLLNSAYVQGDKNNIVKFGEKYYGMTVKTLYLYATNDAYIDKALDEHDEVFKENGKEIVLADSGKVRFSNGLELKNTGLTSADLGQQFKVIYADGKALSVRATGKSVVAESRLQDVTVDIDYKTSSNKAYNKYVFGVDETEYKLGEDYVNVMTIAPADYAKESTVKKFGFTAYQDMNTLAKNAERIIKDAENRADTYKVIDKDGDGLVDYVIITKYEYAQVKSVAESKKYGAYVTAEYATDAAAVKYNAVANLYLDDSIVSDSELEKGNVVKVSWNVEEYKYNFEVLPVNSGVEYEKRNASENLHQLGGEVYTTAANGWTAGFDKFLVKKYLEEKLNIVTDGDLLVMVDSDDNNYTEIADINAQLALVIDAGNEFSNGYIHNANGIKYMTIDGETAVAEYLDKKLDNGEADPAFVQFSQIFGRGAAYGDLSAENTVANRLFILHKSGSKVYLETLKNGDGEPNKQLSAATTLLDGYYATAEQQHSFLDATKSTVKLDNNAVAADNVFFVRYLDSKGNVVYGVKALSDLTGGSDDEAYAQVLTLANARGTRKTVVAGYVSFDLDTDTKTGYLYVTDNGKWDGDDVKVVFADGTEKEISITNENDSIVLNVLYSYTYNVLEDEYTLTRVGSTTNSQAKDYVHQNRNIVDFIDDTVYTSYNKDSQTFDLDDETIAVVTFEIDLDGEHDGSDPMQFSVENTGIEFVALKDLTIEQIEDEVDDNTYTQYTDYVFTSGDVFYVIVYKVMNAAQEAEGFDATTLYNIVFGA